MAVRRERSAAVPSVVHGLFHHDLERSERDGYKFASPVQWEPPSFESGCDRFGYCSSHALPRNPLGPNCPDTSVRSRFSGIEALRYRSGLVSPTDELSVPKNDANPRAVGAPGDTFYRGH